MPCGVKALLHRTEEIDTKFDGLLHTAITKDALSNLATKEDIANLNNKFNTAFEVLNSRLFKQKIEVSQLKAIK